MSYRCIAAGERWKVLYEIYWIKRIQDWRVGLHLEHDLFRRDELNRDRLNLGIDLGPLSVQIDVSK